MRDDTEQAEFLTIVVRAALNQGNFFQAYCAAEQVRDDTERAKLL
ncbi:MAG: hypothetical protein AAF443_09025 [Chlamydiota bacterium]